ncbi:MAG TPA: response regulator [bacterium]|nr:response regulator [bacterium]
MSKTVLVVDDDRQMLELVNTLLTRAGYTVLLAEGAVQALELLEEGDLGAVVLDIMMPVRSGIEVLEHMRWNPRLADLPVIVLSAAHLSQEELDFVKEFSVGFVDKARIGDVLNHLKVIFAKTEQQALGATERK